MREERIDGPCDLVVEIMSPANRRKDRLQKMEIYRRREFPTTGSRTPRKTLWKGLCLRTAAIPCWRRAALVINSPIPIFRG